MMSGRNIKSALAAFLLVFLLPGSFGWAEGELTGSNKCWLVKELKRGDFVLKMFLTSSHRALVDDEELRERYPDGQYYQPVKLNQNTLRKFFFHPPYTGYFEVWRAGKLLYVLNNTGAFSNFSSFEDVFLRGNDYPKRDCLTYSMYFNTGGFADFAGRNLMLTVCPGEERLTAYKTDCYYDMLYERVTGGSPEDEFERVKERKNPPARQVCDFSLKGYGRLEELPTPVRLLMFDAEENKWRSDRPGEFPGFYFRQVPVALNYSGLEIKSQSPLSRTEVASSAQALMDEILEMKTLFVKQAGADLSFVAYSLLMMGIEEAIVRDFFLNMVEEYIKVRVVFDWGAEPESVFNDIVAACRNFSPLERDITYR